MTTTYGPFGRFSDWYQGWRDGVAAIPDPARRVATTAHRELLIRRAQDAFERERLTLETRHTDALQRLAGVRVRREQARAEHDRAVADLAELGDAPAAAELDRRRPGEQERTAVMVRVRRQRDHTRAVAERKRRVDAAERLLNAIEVELAKATEAVAREVIVAGVRVRRIHEHTHRRLAAYRRKLVRGHPAGDWVNSAMDTLAPRMPGWAVRGFGEDESPEPDPIVDQPDDSWPAPARSDVIALGAVTSIGASGSGPSDTATHIEIDGYDIAGQHATLRRRGDGYRLYDHGRGSGTYHDGRPVRRVDLRVGDDFQIGDYEFRLLAGDRLRRRWLGQCALVVYAVDVTSTPNSGRPLLTRMSFIQRPQSLLAVLGPSGAGKSTLFGAVLGELPGIQGERYFQDHDLRAYPAVIRNSLGYVPQNDATLYQSLTVRRLLTYSDRLRRPRDRRGGRRHRVIKACEQLGIARHLHRPVRSLSGGERKRVSIALEILAEPHLLMLDEPTSGLDAAKDHEVMTLLRRYAGKAGRSVITITHNTEHLGLAHQVLVVVSEGRPVYLGPPGAVLTDLAADSYTTLMDRLSRNPGPAAEAYQAGTAVATARRKAEELRVSTGSADRPPPTRTRRSVGSLWRQLPVLVQRQLVLTLSRTPTHAAASVLRRWHSYAVVAMPFIVAIAGAALAGLVVSDRGWADPAPTAAQSTARTALSLLVTLTMLGGQALTYSDVVAEYAVIQREHRTGVLPSAVVLSKWVIFALIAVLQAILVTATFAVLSSGPRRSLVTGPTTELAVDLIATSVTSMSCGLLISVVARRLEQAVALATGSAIAQVALSGGMSTLDGSPLLQVFAWMLPARWGFGASAASVDLVSIAPGTAPDALWQHNTGQWMFDLAILGGLTVCYTAATIVVLRNRLATPQKS